MGRWRLPPEIDSHLVQSQGRNTHTHRHTHRRTHTLTQRHTGTHTDTQTHAGHSALASSTLVSTHQPVWFFKLSQITSLVRQNCLIWEWKRRPLQRPARSLWPWPPAPVWGALCLGPFTQPQRPPCRSPDTCLLWARSPPASQPSRMVFSQTSTWLLQVTGQCFTIFLIILSKGPPGTPYPLPCLVFIHCACHLIKYASICFLSLYSVLNVNSMRIWLVWYTHTHTHIHTPDMHGQAASN